jgi:phage internal scaffolding protein
MTIRKPLERHGRSSIKEFGKTKTHQSFRNEANINTIMAKAYKTGQMPIATHDIKARFGDFSNIPDYQSAQNMIIHANNAFAELPSDIRKRFGNDPQELLEFLDNPKNHNEAREMGLLEPLPAPPEGDIKPSARQTAPTEDNPSQGDSKSE